MNIKNIQSDIKPVRSDTDATIPEINLASSDCPTVPELNLFATGQLPGIDFEILALHIESCDICLNKMDTGLFDNEKNEFLKHIKPIDENFLSELQTPSETLQKVLALAGRGDPAHHIEKYRPLFAKPSFEGDLGTFGKFRIIAEIGYGGMGVVFDAYDTLANRRIALKTLRPDLLGNQTLRELFLDEARNAAKLVHPNIILLLDVDTIEGVPYITMPLLKGESLQEFLTTNPGGVGLPLFMHIARQLLSGLEHLHLKGLVHRDIKPSNIFLETRLDGTLHVILLDLGLARLVEVAGDSKSGSGTPEFAAPEQIQGAKIDARADIFSLGKVFEKMIHGLDHQPSIQPVKIFTLNLHSDPLADLICRMTDPFQTKRPASVKDVIKLLESKRRLKPLRVGVLILPFVLVAMALLIYFSFNRVGPSSDNSSNTNPVTIEPIATPLDLMPANVFSGMTYGLNSISGNGKIFASINYKKILTLNYANDPTKKIDVELPFNPNSVVLNQDGNLLALTSVDGDLSIIKPTTGLVLFTMRDKKNTDFKNLGWGGKNSDVLLFSQNYKLFQLKMESEDRFPDTVSEIQDPNAFTQVLTWENVVPLNGSDFFLANIALNYNPKQILIVYSIAESKIVKFTFPPPNLDMNNKIISSLGWIKTELVFATQNRSFLEYTWTLNNDSKNINMILGKSSELPHAPDDLICLDNNHFIALVDIGETMPSLYLYNRENLSSFRKFETNGECVKQLKKLDGNSFAAFCKSGKVLTYTLSKSLAN
ncbi:MAG: serine/threonine-protein kinase [Planctomycetota bacterium]|nr:serine/threonine-protein kinase [Planctomycetota bacterium]